MIETWGTIEDVEALQAISAAWRAAHQASLRPEPFQSYEFVRAWLVAKPTDAKPIILVGWASDSIRAAWPLMLRTERFLGLRQRTVVPLGSPLIDYADPILLDAVDAGPLVQELVMRARQVADAIVIDNHRAGSPVALAMEKESFHAVPAVECYSRVLDRMELAGDDVNSIVIGATNRRMMRGKINKANRMGPLELRYARDVNEALDMLTTLFAYHRQRWSTTPTPSMFDQPQYREWYRELVRQGLESGAVMVGALMSGDVCLGVHFGLRHGSTLIWTTPSMNPEYQRLSPGLLLAFFTLSTAETHGISVVDFSRGGEGYKAQFCDRVEMNLTSSRSLTLWAHIMLRLRSAARAMLGDGHPLRRLLVRSTTQHD